MPASPSIRRFHCALLLSLTLLVALLVLPAASIARAHKASCHSSATTHAKHKCSTPARKRKPHRAAHHSKPAHAKHKTKTKPAGEAEAIEVPSEAVCEDGSAPQATAEETFSCGDGSMPQCEAGTLPTLSSDGSTLLCEAATSEEEQES